MWTFRSAHAKGTDPVALPAMAVRFAPRLDADNNASARQVLQIPTTVESQAGAVTSLAVEFSVDDGATWQPTPLRSSGTGWAAHVLGPPAGGAVSLRASATHSTGSTAEQTILRAYRTR